MKGWENYNMNIYFLFMKYSYKLGRTYEWYHFEINDKWVEMKCRIIQEYENNSDDDGYEEDYEKRIVNVWIR